LQSKFFSKLKTNLNKYEMKKLITFILLSFVLIASNAYSANLYLIANNGTTWTSTPTGFDNVYKVNLSASGANGTTAVSLQQWLTDRNAITAPTYLINGSAGVTFTTADQIWIAAGTYNFTTQWSILSGSGAIVPAGVYGGFTGTENALINRAKGTNAWEYTHETILNGSGSANGIFNAGGDRTMIIDGLTFTGCPNTAGQAVWQRPNMTIQNCKFTNNACVALKYYISTASKTATTINCYFTNNTNTVSGGAEGGCIMANNSSAGGTYIITGCVFDSNSCTASGSGASAGVKAQGAGSVEINKCIFKNNNATAGNSSAVSLTSATCTLKNSLIYGTSVATNKAAVYLSAGSVINCTVVNNLGGGAYLSNATTATINLTNNVFWGEDVKSGQISAVAGCLGTITNCAYTSLSTNYTGNVVNTVDITATSTGLFADPANNNWMLATGSVLMDMGTATGAPATDLSGITRPQGAGVDIGAYEYLVAGTKNIDAQKLLFKQKGKNLEATVAGKADIYDVQGKICLSKQVQPGDEITLKSGIYFVTLTTAGSRNVQKIIL
jgi:hypothetical protein